MTTANAIYNSMSEAINQMTIADLSENLFSNNEATEIVYSVSDFDIVESGVLVPVADF